MPTPVAVIAGLGGFTSLGITLEEHLAGHQQAETGIRFNDNYPYPLGAVPNFNPRDFIKDKKSIRMMTPQVKLGVSSAALAFTDAQLDSNQLTQYEETSGVIYGSFFCQGFQNSTSPYLACLNDDLSINYESLGLEHYRQFPPLWILPRLPNTTGGQVSIQYGLRGMSYSIVNGPAGAVMAVGEAMEAIQDERASRILAGASESEASVDHAFRLEQKHPVAKTLEDEGIVSAEAGVSFVIESSEIATRRGLDHYGEIAAYQNNYLPKLFKQSKQNTISAIEAHLKKLLHKANTHSSKIDAIQLTLSGIPELDECEAQAVFNVFGGDIPIVCSNDYTGFAYGAAGGCSLLYACLQLKHQYLAPVLNIDRKPLNKSLNYVKHLHKNASLKQVICHHIDYLGNEVSLLINKESKS
ncbi:beta-ketoacyl synthase N-terminal-like domain-containing protein [Vibrio penaeicida]|uniref:beta-ketoacyl synthase N-terminal-like domain-containing protein n=1 Tax=Vibrio penaeicida TaxID=104609 RepID=UPI000CEA67F4|nr:beta-ketoacyl synthase N-terminal-like domain-containing protein [Vibrio penaeicida]